jgi:hypothetical protein
MSANVLVDRRGPQTRPRAFSEGPRRRDMSAGPCFMGRSTFHPAAGRHKPPRGQRVLDDVLRPRLPSDLGSCTEQL